VSRPVAFRSIHGDSRHSKWSGARRVRGQARRTSPHVPRGLTAVQRHASQCPRQPLTTPSSLPAFHRQGHDAGGLRLLGDIASHVLPGPVARQQQPVCCAELDCKHQRLLRW
jgi:hypothetical protein